MRGGQRTQRATGNNKKVQFLRNVDSWHAWWISGDVFLARVATRFFFDKYVR